MIAVFGSQSSLMGQVIDLAEKEGNVEQLVGWSTLPEVLSRASVVILIFPALRKKDVRKVRELRHRCPLMPVIVVSEPGTDSFDAANHLEAGCLDLVWTDRLERLAEILKREDRSKPLERLHETLRVRPEFSAVTLALLNLLLLPPVKLPTSLKTLAVRLGVSAATLRRHWCREVSAVAGIKVLLDWVILLRWLELVSAGNSHERSANTLRVDPRTMQRIAWRRMERTATDCAEHPQEVHAAFEEWVQATF